MTTIALRAQSRREGSRLRTRTDIRAVFDARTSAGSDVVAVRCRFRGDAAPARWTVVAGRRVGTAVARNRAKRRLRAALRSLALPDGVDLVAVAQARAVDAPFGELLGTVERTVARAARRATESSA